MFKRSHYALISAIALPVLFFCLAASAGAPEKTTNEIADGIIRSSRFEGAQQAYFTNCG
jgi:hypothetical protein